jgi:hypothetical protein
VSCIKSCCRLWPTEILLPGTLFHLFGNLGLGKTVRAAASARRGWIDTVALAGSTVVAERQEGERREVGDGVRDAGGEVVGADVQLLQLPQLAEAARDGAGQRVVAEVQADKALELVDLAWHRPRERVVAEVEAQQRREVPDARRDLAADQAVLGDGEHLERPEAGQRRRHHAGQRRLARMLSCCRPVAERLAGGGRTSTVVAAGLVKHSTKKRDWTCGRVKTSGGKDTVALARNRSGEDEARVCAGPWREEKVKTGPSLLPVQAQTNGNSDTDQITIQANLFRPVGMKTVGNGIYSVISFFLIANK